MKPRPHLLASTQLFVYSGFHTGTFSPLTNDRLVVVHRHLYLASPPPDDDRVVDVVVERLPREEDVAGAGGGVPEAKPGAHAHSPAVQGELKAVAGAVVNRGQEEA